MILKKIKSTKPKRKGMHVSDLLRYISKKDAEANAEAEDDFRVGLVGAHGFLTSTLDGRIAEMTALAMECVKSNNPINHYVLSWREGESPDEHQVNEAVDLFLGELGLLGCQAVFAVHKDTRNVHLHLVINKVDPETNKVRIINNHFDIEAGHKAIARIEHVQGWKPEAGARYQVENGLVVDAVKPTEPPGLPPGAEQGEVRSGEISWTSLVKERVGSIFNDATSWLDLHQRLDAVGIRYVKSGSGASVQIEDQFLKASNVDRQGSLAKLQKKFGLFEPAPEGINVYFKHIPEPYSGPPRNCSGLRLRNMSERVVAGNDGKGASRILPIDVQYRGRTPEILRWKPNTRKGVTSGTGIPLVDGQPGWGEFQMARRLRIQERESAKQVLAKAHEDEWLLLRERQRELRQLVIGAHIWAGRGHELNALRAAIREDQQVERKELKSRQREQRMMLRERLRPWPAYADWLADQGKVIEIDLWRYRRVELVYIIGPADVPAIPVDFDGFEAVAAKDAVHYRKAGETEIAFTDRGQHISVWNSLDDETLLAALRLAAMKWPIFEIVGDEEFKRLCVRLAAQHGLPLGNAELQPALEAERIALGLPSPAPEEPTADRFPELLVLESEDVQKPEPSEPEEDSGYVM